MEHRIYLFEVLIERIFFEESVSEIPRKKQIVVSAKLGNIVTLEIRSETLPVGGEGGNKRLIEFRSGKSHLVPLLQEDLLKTLNRQNLEVTVGVRGNVIPIGASSVPWDDCFKEMVQVSDEEFVTPASMADNLCLMENGVIKGNVQIVVRLSCFGKSIQTQFEVLQESGNTQFLFKPPTTATTFICSKYGHGSSSDFIPIGPIYQMPAHAGAVPNRKPASWTALMEGHPSSMVEKKSSLQSVCLFPEYLTTMTAARDSALTFDIVSLRARPEQEKFLNFLTGRKFEDLSESLHSFTVADEEGNERLIYYFDENKKDEPQTESKACQCPKTPIYCKHVYAAIKRYEKSHPDLMIFGKRVNYDKILKNIHNSLEEKSDSLLRLRGGNDEIEPFRHKKRKGCHNPCCKMALKLRSVGISQLVGKSPEREKKDPFPCTDVYCPENMGKNVALQGKFSEDDIPSLSLCQNIYCPAAKMFKKLGLGPLAKEHCQGTIYGPVKPPVQYGLSQTYGTFDTYGPYGIFSKTNTPFSQGAGKTSSTRPVLRLRGGGTLEVIDSSVATDRISSKSPIAECHEIMEQFDEILKEYRKTIDSVNEKRNIIEEYMEPSASPNCGHPRCTYISERALKPIHWDCPDPLPVGICTNPECPYLPDDLKRIAKILKSKEDDRNVNSHTQPKYHKNGPACEVSRDKSNEKCPFYNSPKIVNMMQFWNLSLSDTKIYPSCCSDPNCPLKAIQSSCSNPECAFARGRVQSLCSNPDCPFQQSRVSTPCSNPDCPFKSIDSSGPCSNPDCPFKSIDSSGPCSNPDCPLKTIYSSGPCSNPDCPNRKSYVSESCSNPECPYKNGLTSRNPEIGLSEGSCHNPDCPFNQKDSACLNQQCPFNLTEKDFCGSPKCPYKSQSPSKKTGICRSPNPSICGDKTCPYQQEAGEGKMEVEKDKQTNAGGGGDGNFNNNREKSPIQTKDAQVIGGDIEYTKGYRSSRYDMAPCTLTTCRYMGGKLKCVDCATLTKGRKRGTCPRICSGDVKCPLAVRAAPKSKFKKVEGMNAESEKRALMKARRKFAYRFGDDYPGMHAGHKDCVISSFNVPSKMGWLWNIHTPCLRLKPRKGWRPGAIGKTILEAVQAHRRAQNLDPLGDGNGRRRKKFGGDDESETEPIRPKPTLEIKRKEGVYYITMNPLKDPRSLVPNENPYMEVKPLQFRIMKAKESNEYKSCVCNDQGIVCEPESSSSDSELDIEFTPPAGIIRPERFIKNKNVIHIDTQYNEQDITPCLNEKPKGKEKYEKDIGKGKQEKKSKEKKKLKNDKAQTADKKKKKNDKAQTADKKKDIEKGDMKTKITETRSIFKEEKSIKIIMKNS